MTAVTSVRHIPGNSLPRISMRVVGAGCLIFAGLGILYSVPTALMVYSSFHYDPKLPHFFAAYTTLLVFSFASYATLIFCGVQFVQLRTSAWQVLVVAAIAEVALVFSIRCLWSALLPQISLSVAAASGIGLGGLMPQFVTLFPLWGPVVAVWADYRLRQVPDKRKKKGLCQHCGYALMHESKTCPECGMPARTRT